MGTSLRKFPISVFFKELIKTSAWYTPAPRNNVKSISPLRLLCLYKISVGYPVKSRPQNSRVKCLQIGTRF
jgi:hypothetical protein